MGHRRHGFTLIELMVVIGIIAVIAVIAIPNLLGARISANESAAIATLRSLSNAQALFQNSGAIDEDENGIGEYGFFGELSGARSLRDGSPPLRPAVMSSAFGAVVAPGFIQRKGYYYIIGLPAADGSPVTELGGGTVDPILATTSWGCYAWPAAYGSSGNRTFFVNHDGDIVVVDDSDYNGLDGGSVPMEAGAAFQAPGSLDSITGQIANGTTGRDGNYWTPVG